MWHPTYCNQFMQMGPCAPLNILVPSRWLLTFTQAGQARTFLSLSQDHLIGLKTANAFLSFCIKHFQYRTNSSILQHEPIHIYLAVKGRKLLIWEGWISGWAPPLQMRGPKFNPQHFPICPKVTGVQIGSAIWEPWHHNQLCGCQSSQQHKRERRPKS